MSKLLRANFMRLKKDKVFWLCVLAIFSLAVFNMLNLYRQAKSGVSLPVDSQDTHFFELLPFIGILAAVVISLLFGTEYSDGTMRNKIIVGSTRTSIYMATFVTSAIASTVVTLAWFAGGLVCHPLLGAFNTTFIDLLLNVMTAILTCVALSAVFTFVSIACTNKAVGAVTAILLAFMLMIAGSLIYNGLAAPEMIGDMQITSNGLEFGEPYPNPEYIAEPIRSVLQSVLLILPTGQQILLANLELANPWMCMGLSAIVTVVVTAFGMILYRKKDLK